MRTRRPIRGSGLLVVLVCVLLATSASAAQPELVVRDVYAGGGEPVSAGDFRLVGTAGESRRGADYGHGRLFRRAPASGPSCRPCAISTCPTWNGSGLAQRYPCAVVSE